MLALLFARYTMTERKIEGAPDWAHELLERVASMQEVTKAKVLAGLNDVSEGVGGLAAAVKRIDMNMTQVRRSVHTLQTKHGAMENDLHELRERLLHMEESTERTMPELLGSVRRLTKDVEELQRDVQELKSVRSADQASS